MGFWDELVDKTKQVGEVAGNKADELVQKGKIKYQLEKLTYTLKGQQRKLGSLVYGTVHAVHQQRKLGSLVYGMHRAGTQNEKLLEQCYREIDETLAAMRRARSELNEINVKVNCPKCGFLNEPDASYCISCGYQLISEPDDPAQPQSAGGPSA